MTPSVPGRLPKRLVVAFGCTLAIVFVAELAVMFAIDGLPMRSPWARALLDATLLSLVALPFLYGIAFRPLARHIAERERMDQALRDSEDRYRDLVEHSHDLICTHDLDGRLLSVNAEGLRVTGFPLATALRMNVADLLGPSEHGQFRAYLDEIHASGSASGVMRIRTADGKTRFWAYDNTIRTEEGKAPIVRGVARDITERKRAQSALRASEERFRALIEHGLDLISLLDANGTLLWESPAVTRPLAYPPGTFLGRNIFEIVHPEDAGIVQQLWSRVVHEPGESQGGVFRLRRSDGVWCWMEARATNLLADPSVSAIVVNYRDITERRQAEDTLRLQSAALNAAASGIVITDRDGAIEWVNPAFTAMSGYTEAEALGRNPRDLLKSGVHGAGFYEEFWRTLLDGRVWQGEMINRRKDGTHYPEEQVITPVRDAHGDIRHFIAIKRDLTSEKRVAAQAQQSQKIELVGRLAGGIAHDFNNLLTVINGVAEIALMDVPEDAPVGQDLVQIRAAGLRAAGLTRQLLAFSRQQIMKPVVLNLNAAVSDMRTMLPRLIGEHIALAVDFEDGLGNVLADPGQIEQVILNLAVNARDAMPDGGTLTVTTRNVDTVEPEGPGATPSGPWVMMALADTGAGMDEATQLRMFEPFFTTKEQGKGTGLGLSTVDGIIKQSGGWIRVDSALGQGTTFRVYLPRVSEAASAARVGPADATVPGTETILLVEDETVLCRLAARILRSAGYTVIAAASGEEALDLLADQDRPIHLLLTDVILTGMSGRELARRVVEAHPELPVLYTSGYTDDAVLRLHLGGPATHFIAKPYTAAELTRKVRGALDATSSP